MNKINDTVINTDLAEFVANRVHIPRPLQARVLSITKNGVEILNSVAVPPHEGEELAKAIQYIFEALAMRLTNVWTGQNFDQATGKFTPAQGTRQPVLSVIERYGSPVAVLLNTWIQRRLNVELLFYEPDTTFTQVIHAWQFSGVLPTSTGSNEVKRDLSMKPEAAVYDVPLSWTDMVYDAQALVRAQGVLDDINLMNANPNLAPAFPKKD